MNYYNILGSLYYNPRDNDIYYSNGSSMYKVYENLQLHELKNKIKNIKQKIEVYNNIINEYSKKYKIIDDNIVILQSQVKIDNQEINNNNNGIITLKENISIINQETIYIKDMIINNNTQVNNKLNLLFKETKDIRNIITNDNTQVNNKFNILSEETKDIRNIIIDNNAQVNNKFQILSEETKDIRDVIMNDNIQVNNKFELINNNVNLISKNIDNIKISVYNKFDEINNILDNLKITDSDVNKILTDINNKFLNIDKYNNNNDINIISINNKINSLDNLININNNNISSKIDILNDLIAINKNNIETIQNSIIDINNMIGYLQEDINNNVLYLKSLIDNNLKVSNDKHRAIDNEINKLNTLINTEVNKLYSHIKLNIDSTLYKLGLINDIVSLHTSNIAGINNSINSINDSLLKNKNDIDNMRDRLDIYNQKINDNIIEIINIKEYITNTIQELRLYMRDTKLELETNINNINTQLTNRINVLTDGLYFWVNYFNDFRTNTIEDISIINTDMDLLKNNMQNYVVAYNNNIVNLNKLMQENTNYLVSSINTLNTRINFIISTIPLSMNFILLSSPYVPSTLYKWDNIKNRVTAIIFEQKTQAYSIWGNPGENLQIPGLPGINYNPLNDGMYQKTTSSEVELISEILPIRTALGVQAIKLDNPSTLASDLKAVADTINKEDYSSKMQQFWTKHPPLWTNAIQLPYQSCDLLYNEPDSYSQKTSIEYLTKSPITSIFNIVLALVEKMASVVPGGKTIGPLFKVLNTIKMLKLVDVFSGYKLDTSDMPLPYSGENGFTLKTWNVVNNYIGYNVSEKIKYVLPDNQSILNLSPNGGRNIENVIFIGDPIPIRTIDGIFVDGVLIAGNGYKAQLQNTFGVVPLLVKFPYTHIYGDSMTGKGIGITTDKGKPGLLTGYKMRVYDDVRQESPYAYCQYNVNFSINNSGTLDIDSNLIPDDFNCILLNGDLSLGLPAKDEYGTKNPPQDGWGIPVAVKTSSGWVSYPELILND